MFGAVIAGFLISLGLLLFGKYIKSKYFFLLALYPISLFAYFSGFITKINQQLDIVYRSEWVPQYGINLDFRLDGLSLMFTLLITGIGSLIFLYTHKYLYGNKHTDKFYAYLTMFMSSMLGVVLSDNLIALIVFWELTSISSFFLIGFNTEDEKSRKNAQLALAITGIGGFFLLTGLILSGNIIGSYSIQELLQSRELLHNSPYYLPAIALIFLGAFTKSAQFPFHFWLPNAMKAPTPVSAYLHSATMVKAGIYLLARLTPAFGGHIYWNTTLLIVGAVTMLYASINTLYKTDLKGILAYSTIAVLGMLTMLLGIGTDLALKGLVVFIVAHALYKASLFLITGIIDHETHTRDVTVLSGLRKVMPLLFGAGILTLLSNIGFPYSLGFIGKEMIYESTLGISGPVLMWSIAAVTVISNIFIGYSGYQVALKPFVGPIPEKFEKIKPLSVFLLLPPVLLSVAGIFYGCFPYIADEILLKSATLSVTRHFTDLPLKVWHGMSLTLVLSILTILAGAALYIFRKQTHRQEEKMELLDAVKPEQLYNYLKTGVKRLALFYTQVMHNGYLRIYIMTIILFIICVVGYKLFTEVPIQINTSSLSTFRLYELTVFSIIIVAIMVTIFTSSRLTAIAGMTIVGYCICLMFVFYGAPDLAMTQFTIDTLTSVLFVLVLFKLPPFMKYARATIVTRDLLIAVAFGTLISIITFQALVSPAEKEVSRFYADNAYLAAKGKNVVNVILVDYRGFDTMIESIVLTIAALGVYSLLKLQIKSSDKE